MLDIKTLLVVNLIVDIVGVTALALLWRRYGRRFAGLDLWFAQMAAQTVGLGLVVWRDALPWFMSMLVANALLAGSSLLLLAGTQRFVGVPVRLRHDIVAYAIVLGFITYYSAISPDYAGRTMPAALLAAIIYSQVAWLLFRGTNAVMRRITWIIATVAAGYALASLIRFALFALLPGDDPFLRSGRADSFAVTAYLALHVCLIVAMALTLSRRLLQEVRNQDEKFTKAFQSAPYAMMIIRRRDDAVIEVNDGFSRIFGHDRHHVLGARLKELKLQPAGHPPALSTVTTWREVPLLRRNGEMLTGQMAVDEITINAEECLLASIADVTEESRLKRQLREMALHDSLTGLPNRRFVAEHFELMRGAAERQYHRMAVLSIDLDHFKHVNDTLGHEAGDILLIEAAARFQGCLRKMDVVARFGGDEFVILLPEIHAPDDAVNVAEKVVTSFSVPFVISGHSARVSASVGIALFPDHGSDLADLLKLSDQALYDAKRSGRNGFATAVKEPPTAPSRP